MEKFNAVGFSEVSMDELTNIGGGLWGITWGDVGNFFKGIAVGVITGLIVRRLS